MSDNKIRLQKYIAEAGIASRRKAEELISQGKVKVNGTVINTQGTVVGSGDKVEVDGKRIIRDDKKIYILLNKPEGYITSASDEEGRKTVMDLVTETSSRLFPVGRLDYNTSGLLILTNDGDFANMLSHPSSGIEKEYIVKISSDISDEQIGRMLRGIPVEGYTAKAESVSVLSSNSKNTYLSITLVSGRNREIRNMFEALGCGIVKLKRVRIGNIDIGFLKKGHYRTLLPGEIEELKRLCVKSNKNQ